ncbi:hypothetical protein EN809_039010, partial [Mesorhizobium sp. M2E.F.Ca.ET.166.01.1.1]
MSSSPIAVTAAAFDLEHKVFDSREIAIVDGNYPAEEQARRLIRADGHHVIPVLDAVLSVLPVDEAVPQALFRASVKGDPALADPVHREMEAVCA